MNSTTLAIILIVIGIAFLTAEYFIPDFGIMGLAGIASIVVAIIILANSIVETLIMLGIFALILGVGFWVLSRSFRKGNSKLVLKDKEDPDRGYTAFRIDSSLIGQTGKALTDLHPSGAATIENQRLDVVTQGDYIKKGQKLIVMDVQGRRILVKKAED